MRIFLLLLLGMPTLGVAQENTLSVPSTIQRVTIFLKGAEIQRAATIALPVGKSKIAFTGLSAQLNPQTIQLSGEGFTILSLSHKINYLDEKEKSETLGKLEVELQRFERQQQTLETERKIFQQEKEVLLANKSIGGTVGVSAETLRAAMDYFSTKLRSLETALLKNAQDLNAIKEDIVKIEGEIKEITSSQHEKTMQVEAVVQTETASQSEVQLQYIVSDAGWIPTYDIRVESISEPIRVTYKANVYQNTGIDWEAVRLTISSGNPQQSGTSPTLRPTYLDFSYNYGNQNIFQLKQNITYGNAYTQGISQVSGVVIDENTGDPLPGVNVFIKGSTIGTMTNLDGKYALNLPEDAQTLMFSYIGFVSKELPVQGEIMNVALSEDITALEEVVVTGYKGKAGGNLQEKKAEAARSRRASAPTVAQFEFQTNFAYEIEQPYSIPTNGKLSTVELITHEIPSDYKYNVVPKLIENAFLVADVTEWSQYNFLEGEANLYFENRYIGRSILNTKFVSDTLRISLGRDDDIIVKRTRLRDFEKRKSFSNKKREERVWEIALKNLKNEAVTLKVHDQIPISSNQDIRVDDVDTAGATLSEETGELVWHITLAPNEQRKLTFRYAVEYPRDRTVKME